MFGFFRSPKAATISPAEAHEKLKNGEITLVDVREAGEWAQTRIPGAVHAPLSNFQAHLEKIKTDKPIVFHCLSGHRSAKAVSLCRALGKPHDTHVAGGLSAWMASGLPVKR